MYSAMQIGKAQFWRDLAKNVTRGQLQALRDGRRPGTAPFEYTAVKGKLTIDPDKAAVVRRVFNDYLAGQSVRQIAAACLPGEEG